MEFSFIIPTYGKLDLLTACIESVKRHEKDTKNYEIIVVDDFSSKENRIAIQALADRMDFILVCTDKNVGFPTAVNTGLTHARGRYLILCNNDVELHAPVLERFKASHEAHTPAAIIGCKLFYPNGAIQHGGVEFNDGIFHHTNDLKSANKSRYCIAVTFALVSVVREFYQENGGLDSGFFIACDDSEYCLRAWKNGWRVYYDSNITAIHAEGATRGRTYVEKVRNQKWFEEEAKSIVRLQASLGDINTLLQQVKDSNWKTTGPLKIEIGCGTNPQPGYEHIDARELPDVDHVLDFANELLPYGSDTVEEILSNHSIEHVSYRRLPFVLQEWNRVLKTGGRLFLRTPDLEFICKTYLAGKMTPEWPDDEKYIRQNFGEMTPAWWANIKLYAGQDYPGNFHLHCFDFEMLKSTLEKYGFERVMRLSINPVFSPGELQVEAFKKAPRLRTRVRRSGALGDVILMTPLIQALSQKEEIHVTTDCPDVFRNFPGVSSLNTNVPCDRVIDLDLAYEKNPKTHILDAYAEVARCPESRGFTPWLDRAEHPLPGIENYIVVHAAVSWENRTWPKHSWEEFIRSVQATGIKVVSVGSGNDHILPEALAVRGITIHQIASLIAGARAFVGSDSGILHVAATTPTPIVGLFTCAKGEYRLPRRENAVAVKTELECYGCLHELTPPVTFAGCKRGDNACVRDITASKVFQALERLLRPQSPA